MQRIALVKPEKAYEIGNMIRTYASRCAFMLNIHLCDLIFPRFPPRFLFADHLLVPFLLPPLIASTIQSCHAFYHLASFLAVRRAQQEKSTFGGASKVNDETVKSMLETMEQEKAVSKITFIRKNTGNDSDEDFDDL